MARDGALLWRCSLVAHVFLRRSVGDDGGSDQGEVGEIAKSRMEEKKKRNKREEEIWG
jgi:hypothetical protein